MSKAFTKESEAEADFEDEIRAPPAATKNYITPEGFHRLQDEFSQLQKIERPKTLETVSWAAGNGDRSENGDYIYGKRRLREIDGRMRFLRKEWKSPKPSIPRGNRIESGSISARRSFIVRGVKKGRLGS
jgi:transcription elongation factor GreB